MRTAQFYKWTKYLAAIGVGLAIYLMYEYLAPAHQSICYVNATVNCEASTKGVLANTLGIPTALWGLSGYIVIFLAAVKKWPKVLLGMTAFGFLFCLRITFLELLVVKAICPVCIACQIIMLVVFLMAVVINAKKGGDA